MDIKTSIAITERYPRAINIIVSGAFARVYNQSYYLSIRQLKHGLKPTMRYVKSAENRFVIYGGFPVERVLLLFPDAVKISWGYQLNGNFDINAYANWLLQCEAEARACASSVTATDVGGLGAELCAPNAATPFSKNGLNNQLSANLMLDEQQLAYLSQWQKGLYPIETDLGFIESIKQALLHSE